MMKNSLLFAVTLSLLAGSTALAIEPTAVDYNSDTSWSRAVYNKFDGYTVYDRHKVGDRFLSNIIFKIQESSMD